MVGNINERRAYIKALIERRAPVNIREVARMFGSSYSAVTNDIGMIESGTPVYTKKLTTGQNTRARKMGVPGVLEESEWQATLEAHNNACASCGSTKDISIDHIIPVSKGGANTSDNIQPLCRRCNSRKGNRT
jgi:hypothetical protein